jgi:PAS domain S-box-containing protein
MPPECEMAFVVLVAGDRQSKFELPQSLSKRTGLIVRAAHEGAHIAPGHVFVIRRGAQLSISRGQFKVAPTLLHEEWPALIDNFMKALAADHGKWGIGIILSGTGADGVQGLKALKEVGGLTLVEEPAEAEYAGGLRQAIVSARPDHVLPATRMAEVLKRYLADAELAEARAANEELKRKDEEPLSLKEEVLSTAEELKMSREELQSLIQELTEANKQLRDTLEQQRQTTTDLSNLLDNSPVGTILLDDALRIKVFNSRIALTNVDIGRPLSDVISKFTDPTLEEDARAALLTGTPSVREIQGAADSWYVRSVLPYRTTANEIRGAVVTFTDVTALKQAELASASARKYAETIVDIAREPLAVIDANMRVESMNSAFSAAMNLRPDRATGQKLQDLDQPLLAHPSLIELMERVLDAGSETGDVELEIEGRTGERMWKAHVRGFRSTPSDRSLILLALEDITEQRRIVRHQLQLLIDALPEPTIAVDGRRRMRLVSRHMEALFGYQPTELIGEKIDILLPPEVREKNASFFKEFTAKPSVRGMGTGLDVPGVRKDGVQIPLDIGLSPIATAD